MFRKNRSLSLIICLITLAALLLYFTGCSFRTADIAKSVTAVSNLSQKSETLAQTNSKASNTLSPKLVFKENKQSSPLALKFKSTPYTARVKDYKINSDLSNISNISQFGSFTKEQKELIAKNGFCAVSSQDEQLFYIYEDNQYLKIPSFITADSVLQVYNVFFDFSLRTLESDKLLSKLTLLSNSMLSKSITQYNQLISPKVKAAALRNSAFFAVAETLLSRPLPKNLPPEAKKLADKELLLIKNTEGLSPSPIFSYKLDYSQYIPRGHYTRNEGLKKYFKAMMWYGQAPFVLFKDSSEKMLDLNTTLQALLITYSLYYNNNSQSDITLWEAIYNPTEFYVGKSDDLNVYNYKTLILNVYGKNLNLNKLTDTEKLNKLVIEGHKQPGPKIKGKWTDSQIPVGKQFRLMGQRYIPDSEILQNLCTPIKRPFPKGLDVMAVLGSSRAKDILLNIYKEDNYWNGYSKNLSALQRKYSSLKALTWQSNMYYGWLWSLNPLIKAFGKGYPLFMQNKAWEDKSLNTALASWSELRHDTILYAKQSGAECGGGEEPPVIKGYVEPNIDFYDRLLWLTQYSRKNLSDHDVLSSELQSKLQSFEFMLSFLINCSVKELRNEELTKEEYFQLLIYGGLLEQLSTSLAGGYKGWYEITSDTDRNMSVIADVHGSKYSYLEEGVGPASQIFVAVPIGNKIYLTRGAIFSYYEFINDKRLTDEEWQKMLKNNKAPQQPEWTKSYTSGKNKKVPIPKEPYSSGC